MMVITGDFYGIIIIYIYVEKVHFQGKMGKMAVEIRKYGFSRRRMGIERRNAEKIDQLKSGLYTQKRVNICEYS